MAHIFMFMPVLALVLFLFLPWPFALITYLPITAFSLAVAYKAMKAQRQLPVSGQAAMIGDRAVVVSDSTGETRVRYRSEIWRAISPQALHRDQQVVIEGVKGLTLQVVPLARGEIWEGKPTNHPNRQKSDANPES